MHPPWASLEHHGDWAHQVGHASNTHGGCQQLPHVHQGLFPGVPTSPAGLGSQQEAAAGHLRGLGRDFC